MTAGDAEQAIRDAMRHHAAESVSYGYRDLGSPRQCRAGDDSAHAGFHAGRVLQLERALAALIGTERAEASRQEAWRLAH